MATKVRGSVWRMSGEPAFFAGMAAACAIVVIVGFGLNAGLGRGRYAELPGAVYLHALLYVGWCALAVAQPVLIGTGRWSLHRTLGWAGAALAIAMAVSGLAVTVAGVRAGRTQPANIFLMLNILTVVCFLTLVIVAVRTRRATDWHRRLLTCATIILTGAAWARILPMDLLGPLGLAAITLIVLGFVAWGARHDRRTRGRVHPAWYWGGVAVAVPGVLTPPLAFLPAFATWAGGFAPAG